MSGDPLSARFTMIEQIGGGNYGTLFRVIDGEAASLADRIIATKKLKDAINHPHVLREVSVQRQAQRCTRHVAKLLHVVPRDQVRAALVLEYLPFDLRVFLNAFYCDRVVSSAPTWCATESCGGGIPPTHIPLPYVRKMLRGLLEALQCLHARGVAHRDVKPENILVEPLGLDHPLRCVCPPLKPSGASGGGGCWVHCRPGDACASSNTNTNTEDAPAMVPSSSPSASPTPSLEPCRCFFDGTVCLHHELTGEELASEVHRLHCAACRLATTTNTTTEEEEEETRTPSVRHSDPVELPPLMPLQHAEEERAEAHGEASLRTTSPHSPPPLSPDVKLCDFGSARHIGTLRLCGAEEQREQLTPGPTTPVYCAPEMMLLQRYGTAVDMWAVGTIFFEMLTGEFFLSVGTLRSFYGDLVVHDDYCVMHRLRMMFTHLGTPSLAEWRSIAHPQYYAESMLTHLPQISQAALFKCLPGALQRAEGDEESREDRTSSRSTAREQEADAPATADDTAQAEEAAPSWASPLATKSHDESLPDLSAFLLHHVGVCGLDLLRSLLRYNPAERLTAAEALRHPFFASGTEEEEVAVTAPPAAEIEQPDSG